MKGVNKETGEILKFNSASEAQRHFGKGRTGSISTCCRGKQKSAYGYIWSYIDDVEETGNKTQSS